SPDGRRLATGSYDGKLKLWDARTGKELRTLSVTGKCYSVAFSPDGRFLAAGCGTYDPEEPAEFKVWDATTLQEVRTSVAHSGCVTPVAFGSDGGWLAWAGMEGLMRVWDLETGRAMGFRFPRDPMGYTAMAFSPDGRRLAASSGAPDIWASRRDPGEVRV